MTIIISEKWQEAKKAIITNDNLKVLNILKLHPEVAIEMNESSMTEPNLLACAITHARFELIEPLIQAKSAIPYVCLEQFFINYFWEKEISGRAYKEYGENKHLQTLQLFMDILNISQIDTIKEHLIKAQNKDTKLGLIQQTVPIVLSFLNVSYEKKMFEQNILNSHVQKNKLKI